MIKQFLKRCYRLIPGLRELTQMRDLLHGFCNESTNELTRIRTEISMFRSLDAIRLLDFELREHPRYGDPRRLLRYQFQVCSQLGDDGIIREILHRVGTVDRTFAEVGVGDGKENNTAFLLAQGWRGFWIDGNPSFIETIKEAPGSMTATSNRWCRWSPGRTQRRYSSNSASRRSSTCSRSTSTRTPITCGRASATIGLAWSS